MKSVLVLLAILATVATASAESIPLPTTDTGQTDLGGQLEYLVDTTGGLSLDDAAAAKNWQPGTGSSANFGFDLTPHFFRIRVRNPSPHPESWIWTVPFPLLDALTIRITTGRGSLSTQELWTIGDDYPFDQRPIQTRHLAFPMSLAPHTEADLLLRIQTTSAVKLPLFVATRAASARIEQRQQLGYGIYFGLLGIMIFYNLFLYFSTRHSIYLHYIGYVGALLSFQLTYQGFLQPHLSPRTHFIGHEATGVSLSLVTLFMMSFAYQFLNLRSRHPRLAWIFRRAIGLCLVMFILALVLPNRQVIFVVLSILGVACPLSQVAGIIALHGGFKPSRFYILAWCSVLVSAVVELMTSVGWLPPHPLTQNGVQIGTAAEVALTAFALADRINVLRHNAETSRAESLKHEQATRASQRRLLEHGRALRVAQNKVLEVERRVTETLERSVKERTAELAEANRRLLALSVRDSLTDLPNRRHFEAVFRNESRRSERANAPLAVLAIDIDHFKKVNDTHGHSAGDACLREVAQVMRDTIQRPGDHLARMGGEEFAALLSNTDLKGAKAIAEQLRLAVQTLRGLTEDARSVRLTISIGIAIGVPRDVVESRQLLDIADKMLYQAKTYGRNRVEG